MSVETNEIYQTLRDRICFLIYSPGTSLGEVELAAEFGVSRTPIRTVLVRLEVEGLVVTRRGVGTIVTGIDREATLQALELRKELALLLVNMSPSQDLELIGQGVSQLLEDCQAEANSISIPDFARLNARLFELMKQLTLNRPLREVSEQLYYLTARLWVHAIPKLSLQEELAHFMQEMRELKAALDSGDIQAVGHIRWIHLSKSIHRQIENMKLDGDQADQSPKLTTKKNVKKKAPK